MEQERFVNGGWWHDSSVLAATGEGVEKEEPRAWEGWWNERVVELVRLSMEEKDALSVLLTGRGEDNFGSLIKRIVASKQLEFDLICLKPKFRPSTSEAFASTMLYKQALLNEIIYTYSRASEIRVYEDRPKHIVDFRQYFTQLNTSINERSNQSVPQRLPIAADVIQIQENAGLLDAATEIAAVQRMINLNNIAYKSGSAHPRAKPYRIARDVCFTAYMLPLSAQDQLQSLMTGSPYNQPQTNDIRFLANAIMIFPRPGTAPASLLTRVGGIGHSVQWRVSSTACLENRIWAAKVVPINPQEKVATDPNPAVIVLALRRGAKPQESSRIRNWQPVPADKAFIFDSTVGEKVILRIEEETGPAPPRPTQAGKNRGSGGGVPLPESLDVDGGRPAKRVHTRDQDFISLGGADDGKMNGYGYGQGIDENRRLQQDQAGISVGNRGPGGQFGQHNQQRGGGRGGGARSHERPPVGRSDRPPGGSRGSGSGSFGSRGARGGKGRGTYRSLDDMDGAGGGRGYRDHDAAYARGGGGGGEGLRYDY